MTAPSPETAASPPLDLAAEAAAGPLEIALLIGAVLAAVLYLGRRLWPGRGACGGCDAGNCPATAGHRPDFKNQDRPDQTHKETNP